MDKKSIKIIILYFLLLLYFLYYQFYEIVFASILVGAFFLFSIFFYHAEYDISIRVVNKIIKDSIWKNLIMKTLKIIGLLFFLVFQHVYYVYYESHVIVIGAILLLCFCIFFCHVDYEILTIKSNRKIKISGIITITVKK